MPVSDAHKKANRKWDENNKARKAYLSKRSTSRNFIKKLATQSDLDEFKELISNREEELK